MAAVLDGSPETVEARLQDSLSDLCAFRRKEFLGARMRSRVAVAHVGQRPTTALVLAIYQAEGWRPTAPDWA